MTLAALVDGRPGDLYDSRTDALIMSIRDKRFIEEG